MRKPQTLKVMTLTSVPTVGGRREEARLLATVENAPYRIAKRMGIARAAGLRAVRAIGPQAVIYANKDREEQLRRGGRVMFLAVIDGKGRELAKWKALDIGGFTGTHDRAPEAILRGANA